MFFTSLLQKIKKTVFIISLLFSNIVILLGNDPIEMHWSTNPNDYSDNMTVTAVVIKNDVEMRSDMIEIGAFSDEECRGSVLLNYTEVYDRYIGFLMVYGNGNEAITFKVYNHETETEHTAINTPLNFSPNAIHGNSYNPYIINLGIEPEAPVITIETLQNGQVDVEYLETLVAEGDAPITWSLETGSLPAGLTLSTAGVISGTPTAAGTFTFTVVAINAVGYDTKSLSIEVEKGTGALVGMPTLDIAGIFTINIYAVTPPANGQTVEYGINTVNALPTSWQSSTTFAGLSSNTTYYIFARSAENANYYAGLASGSLEATTGIDAIPPTIITTDLPDGYVGAVYEETLYATGDAPIIWTLTAGSLPSGLSFSSAGVISGTPNAVGIYSFTVKADNITTISDTKSLSIEIQKGTPTYTIPTDLTAVFGDLLSTVTLPSGWAWETPTNFVGNAGLQTHTATFTPSDVINYNIVTLGLEVMVDKAAGAAVSVPVVSETPTQTSITVGAVTLTPSTTGQVAEYAINQSATTAPTSGWQINTTFNELDAGTSYYVWARSAENDNYYAGEEAHSAAITTADANMPPVITTDTLPNGTVGLEYNETLTATGDQPIMWSVVAGLLPKGLTLSPEGILSGTPIAADAFIFFKVRATNDVGSDDKDFAMIIYPENSIHEHPVENPLKAWVSNSHLYLKGLTIGKTVSIYTLTGALMYQNIATSEEAVIPLPTRGVYILNQGKYTIKVVY